MKSLEKKNDCICLLIYLWFWGEENDYTWQIHKLDFNCLNWKEGIVFAF